MYKHLVLYPFKRVVLMLGFAAIMLAANGCSSKAPVDSKVPSDRNTPAPNSKDSLQRGLKGGYRCPMKCTEELYDTPGKCKVCNMDLEKVSPS